MTKFSLQRVDRFLSQFLITAPYDHKIFVGHVEKLQPNKVFIKSLDGNDNVITYDSDCSLFSALNFSYRLPSIRWYQDELRLSISEKCSTMHLIEGDLVAFQVFSNKDSSIPKIKSLSKISDIQKEVTTFVADTTILRVSKFKHRKKVYACLFNEMNFHVMYKKKGFVENRPTENQLKNGIFYYNSRSGTELRLTELVKTVDTNGILSELRWEVPLDFKEKYQSFIATKQIPDTSDACLSS